MPQLQEKLRRFRETWNTAAAVAPADPGQVLGFKLATPGGFKFNADDSPRFRAREAAAFRRPARSIEESRAFPRFAKLAEHDDVPRADNLDEAPRELPGFAKMADDVQRAA